MIKFYKISKPAYKAKKKLNEINHLIVDEDRQRYR